MCLGSLLLTKYERKVERLSICGAGEAGIYELWRVHYESSIRRNDRLIPKKTKLARLQLCACEFCALSRYVAGV